MRADFSDLGTNEAGYVKLGSAGPWSFYRDFPHAPIANTFYPVAPANRLASNDLEPGGPDIVASFTSDAAANWYFGTNHKPPANKTEWSGSAK